MKYNFEKWVDYHNKYKKKLTKIKNHLDKLKCLSALEVMATSMQEINEYIIDRKNSVPEFCYLIRNIDVYISSLIMIHSILFKKKQTS